MIERRFKPSRPGSEHRGYHGNQPVKKDEGTGGLVLAGAPMPPALPSPCVECPLRRDSAPGYLGGYTPKMYLEILHSPASIACHARAGFHSGETGKQRHCAGVAAFRANVGHVCELHGVLTKAQESTDLIGQDKEHYFASDQELVAHHEKGRR